MRQETWQSGGMAHLHIVTLIQRQQTFRKAYMHLHADNTRPATHQDWPCPTRHSFSKTQQMHAHMQMHRHKAMPRCIQIHRQSVAYGCIHTHAYTDGDRPTHTDTATPRRIQMCVPLRNPAHMHIHVYHAPIRQMPTHVGRR